MGLLFPYQEEWGQNYNEITNSTIVLWYGYTIFYLYSLENFHTDFQSDTLVCIPTRIVKYIFFVSSTLTVLVRFLYCYERP